MNRSFYRRGLPGWALLVLVGIGHARGATFNIAAGDVAGLKTALTTANSNGQADVINLSASSTYTLPAVDNDLNGPNGLPVILDDAAGLDLTINGNGALLKPILNGVMRLLYIGPGAQVRLNEVRISGGRLVNLVVGGSPAASHGAGIYNEGSSLTMNRCNLSGNVCDSDVGDVTNGAGGGGLYNTPGNLVEMFDCNVSGNAAKLNGGGIQNAGTVTMERCLLSGNSGTSGSSAGGAIYNASSASTYFGNCTLASGVANLGGGIYNRRGSVVIRNSTMHSSQIYNDGAGGSASVSLGSTILYDFSAQNVINNAGTIISVGHNLSSDAAGGDATAGPGGFLNGTGDIRNTNPLLGFLQLHGGVIDTFSLGSASPAIDKGVANGFSTDQRGFGFPRTIEVQSIPNGTGDGTDIGAYEFTPGTIPQSGQLIISEFRVRGPFNAQDGVDGARDEYFELYNPSGRDISLNSVDGSSGIALAFTDAAGSTVTTAAVVPENIIIPAGGHYLLGSDSDNGRYGIGSYASPNGGYSADIPDNAGIALFNTSNPANFSPATRLDAVSLNNGNGTYSSLFREGTFLVSPGPNDGQYAFVRKQTFGHPQDSDDNASDFVFVSPNAGSYGGVQSQLGAPGPEGSGTQVVSNSAFEPQLIEPNSAAAASPNQVRSLTPVTNGAQGTLSIRRRLVNKSSSTLTSLRFRIVDLTTLNSPGYSPGGAQADLRVLDSSGFAISTSRGSLSVSGTTLQQPSPIQQGNGGGLNSSLSVGLPAGGLLPNASIDLHFLLGVQQAGTFRFRINLETSPAAGLGVLKISSLTRLGNGHAFLQGTGPISTPLLIEKSGTPSAGSFAQPTLFSTNGSGNWQFDDSDSAGVTTRFYHASVAPLLVSGATN